MLDPSVFCHLLRHQISIIVVWLVLDPRPFCHFVRHRISIVVLLVFDPSRFCHLFGLGDFYCLVSRGTIIISASIELGFGVASLALCRNSIVHRS